MNALPPHKTRTIQVWVDVDEGIVDHVIYLNTIPGVRTLTSCEGTIGAGGENPYRGYAMCRWTPKALIQLRTEFEVGVLGNDWGRVYPKGLAHD